MKKKYIIIIFTCIILLGSGYESYCETFIDSMGRKIKLEKVPERIVSLAPSITEILYYLGLGDRVVGVTKFSYYPPEAKQKPDVGSYVKVNIESIITLGPEIVIGTADGNEPKVVDLLEQAGIDVYIINPRNVRDVIKTIALIGHVCGVGDKADKMTRRLNERVDFVISKVKGRKRPLVFLQINLKPIMTVNHNTFHHDLINMAGGINMTGDMEVNYPRISIEELISKRPEVMIISSMDRGGRFEVARKEWMQWTSIPAVRDNRVRLIDSDLIDRPSPRIVDGLEAMARIIHPDAGWE